MIRKLLPMLILVVAFAEEPQTRPKTASKVKETSLTGCLDQRQEAFVLRSGTDMTIVTKLKGKAFGDDNFARYVGQKVTVSGAVEGDTMQVRNIQKVADTCSS